MAQIFGHSNSLCARVMRAIINHAPIREYQLRFFSREDFSCPCGFYPLELRCHILYKCKRFNKYWNLRRDTISHFILFLEFNSSMFVFENVITQSFFLINNLLHSIWWQTVVQERQTNIKNEKREIRGKKIEN